MIARLHVNAVLIVVTIILSAASAVVVLQGASGEPYASFRASDALIQIGVAMVLINAVWLIGTLKGPTMRWRERPPAVRSRRPRT